MGISLVTSTVSGLRYAVAIWAFEMLLWPWSRSCFGRNVANWYSWLPFYSTFTKGRSYSQQPSKEGRQLTRESNELLEDHWVLLKWGLYKKIFLSPFTWRDTMDVDLLTPKPGMYSLYLHAVPYLYWIQQWAKGDLWSKHRINLHTSSLIESHWTYRNSRRINCLCTVSHKTCD